MFQMYYPLVGLPSFVGFVFLMSLNSFIFLNESVVSYFFLKRIAKNWLTPSPQ